MMLMEINWFQITFIKEYISFLKFKVFEILTNQTNDETFNQLQQKLMYYKAAADEAYIMADIEIKNYHPGQYNK
jgi:hypothetical protein